jgi:hypothetical protein
MRTLGLRCLLVLGTLALTGCASMSNREVHVEPITLPTSVTPSLPARVGVVFPEPLRTARLETAYLLGQDRYSWRHDIGSALTGALRQALSASFERVIELDRLPADGRDEPEVDAIIVPAVTMMSMEMPQHSVVWLLHQRLQLGFDLYSPSGARLGQWSAEGMVGIGAHGPVLMRQGAVDQALLRSAMAAVVASVHTHPALGPLRDAVAKRSEPGRDPDPLSGASPRASAPLPSPTTAAHRVDAAPSPADGGKPTVGTVVLRLDAGLARDDGIETRVARCLAPALTPATGLGDAQPASALRDALFPWLDPGAAPRDTEAIATLLARPAVRDRLRQLGVGHLVLLQARDSPGSRTDALGCFVAIGGGGCLGHFEQTSGYIVDLAIWDPALRQPIGVGLADVSRTLGVLGVVLPIPYTFTNERDACSRMRDTVERALGLPR